MVVGLVGETIATTADRVVSEAVPDLVTATIVAMSGSAGLVVKATIQELEWTMLRKKRWRQPPST